MSGDNPLSLLIDLERCTGCKSCEAACKQSNALGPHTYRNRVMWFGDDASDTDAFSPRLVIFSPSLASNANGLPVFAPVLSAQKP